MIWSRPASVANGVRRGRLIGCCAALLLLAGTSPALGASITVKPVQVTIPQDAQVRVEIDRGQYDGQVQVAIYDVERGELADRCLGYMTVCYGNIGTGWSENARPKAHTFSAVMTEMWPGGGTQTAPPVSVRAKRRRFKIDLSFQKSWTPPPPTPVQWQATATSDYSFNGTPYHLVIRDETRAMKANCSSPNGPGLKCGTQVPAGHAYRATMEDSEGRVFGMSSHFAVTADEAIEERIAGFDLVTLAALFASAHAVCDELLFAPGTHLNGSSLTDQWLACDAAAGAGLSAREAIRAAAVAAGGAAAAAVVSHLRAVKDPSVSTEPATAPWLPAPDPDPEPPPRPFVPLLSDEWNAEDVASELQRLDPTTLAGNQPVADALANQCLALVAKRLAAIGLGAQSPHEACTDDELPIFAPGADIPGHTRHNLDAIRERPDWVWLHRREPPHDRGWLDQTTQCQDRQGMVCDEYPFASTVEGGEANSPSLRLLDPVESAKQGGLLSWLYADCSRTHGAAYLVVPLPPALGLPTSHLCKRAA